MAHDARAALRPPDHGGGAAQTEEPRSGNGSGGIVGSVGKDVTRFRPGDEVFGRSLGANLWRNGGTFAEQAAVPEAGLERKPGNLTFEQAAAVATSGPIAVQGVRDEGRVQAGQTVLINGAGGAVGTFAVQLAKVYGAHVTGVDAPGKLEMLRAARTGSSTTRRKTSLGAAIATTSSSTSWGTIRGRRASARSHAKARTS